jgi:protein-disulfide isomerase
VPREPRQKSVVPKKQGDTLTRNIAIGMVALVVLSGVIFTLLGKRTATVAELPTAITQIDSSNNGEALIATVEPADDYGIVFNKDLKPRIDIWEDFQCPFCNVFEKSMSTYLENVIRNKEAKVVFHMASFIGADSVRAANAANCAVAEGRFIEFHRALYQIQGAENSSVYTNANLVEVGKRLGITNPTFESCVTEGKYGDIVKNVANSMAKNNVNGTPTVFINGKLWERSGNNFVVEELKAAVDAAKQ